MNKPKLKLIGEDGNAFFILGRALSAAKNAGWTKEQIEEYSTKAKSGDYNNLLCVTMEYFNCDGDDSTDEELDAEICEECGDTLLFCECDERYDEEDPF